MKTFTYQSVKTTEVAEADFPEKMNWENAKAACENLGEGWRLPAKEEMAELFENYYLKGLGNFASGGDYWLSDHNTSALFRDTMGYYAGYEYKTKFDKHGVRAVRSTKVITDGKST
jgi:hypothetical protein